MPIRSGVITVVFFTNMVKLKYDFTLRIKNLNNNTPAELVVTGTSLCYVYICSFASHHMKLIMNMTRTRIQLCVCITTGVFCCASGQSEKSIRDASSFWACLVQTLEQTCLIKTLPVPCL